jgi:hypothetical protein
MQPNKYYALVHCLGAKTPPRHARSIGIYWLLHRSFPRINIKQLPFCINTLTDRVDKRRQNSIILILLLLCFPSIYLVLALGVTLGPLIIIVRI